jgi:hypothetical protein
VETTQIPQPLNALSSRKPNRFKGVVELHSGTRAFARTSANGCAFLYLVRSREQLHQIDTIHVAAAGFVDAVSLHQVPQQGPGGRI